MMENHSTSPSTSPCFFFENNNGSLYPSDLVLTMIEDGASSASSSPLSSNSSTSSNGNLSPTSSHQSLGISSPTSMSFPCCVFRCRPSSHPFQERCIPLNEPIKVGRAVGRLKPLPNNAIFDCKVLSRQHAKLWYENGKFLLQDTKSSNGTFVNNQRLGKCNEESLPFEIYSGDIIQFGVDVTENNRKTTHNCIIIEVKLYHSDGNEALPRSANGQSLAQVKELDISSQTLYQLANYLQEAMHREQMLEQKLEYLQGVIRDTQQASNDGWQAIIDEDRLLTRINALEDQLRIYHAKNPNADLPTQELVQLQKTRTKFEEESKNKLEKAILERADALSRSKSLESTLQMAQDELKRLEEQNDRHKDEIQKLVQSLDEQRSLIAEFELKFRESQNRCVELENERQRIQNDFENYYQQTEELQKQKALSNKSPEPIDQNGVDTNAESHGRFVVQSSSKDSLANHENANNSDHLSNSNETELPVDVEIERDHQRPTIIPTVIDGSPLKKPDDENLPIIDEEKPNSINGDHLELIEAQKQVESLRDHLQKLNERLISMEDTFHKEEERYHTLSTDYQNLEDELSQLRQRSIKEKVEQNNLIETQQSQLETLTDQIVCKQSEHDQVLSLYLCFFLSCYLLIFFLFFFLLSW